MGMIIRRFGLALVLIIFSSGCGSNDGSGGVALRIDVPSSDESSFGEMRDFYVIGNFQPELAAQGPFDGVVHLASLFMASHRSEDVLPLLTSNILFATRLLDAAVRSGVQWFVNTGTAWQHYEGRGYSPVNLYAATKQAFESLAQYYVEAHGLRFVTLALGDTYGPGDTRSKLLNLWCRIAKAGTPLDMSAGLQKIDLVYVSDVAEAFQCAVERFQSVSPCVILTFKFVVCGVPGRNFRWICLTCSA